MWPRRNLAPSENSAMQKSQNHTGVRRTECRERINERAEELVRARHRRQEKGPEAGGQPGA